MKKQFELESSYRVVMAAKDAVETLGFSVDESAVVMANEEGTKALNSGLLMGSEELAICTAALFVAGGQIARDRGRIHVLSDDLQHAWDNLLACPGNLPPHQCYRTSVIQKIDLLRTDLPGFATVLDNIAVGRKW